jgi:hypothetical protein
MKTNEVVFKGFCYGNLYLVDFTSHEANLTTCLISKTSKGWLWHCRIAHIDMSQLKKAFKKGMVLGVKDVTFEKDKLCSVGDSPRGPLKQLGNPHLKPATKPKPSTPYLTMQDMAHAAKAPAAHQAAHSKTPSNRFRLAQGCAPPSGRLRPVRGGAPPSSEVRLARGHSAHARLLPYAGI